MSNTKYLAILRDLSKRIAKMSKGDRLPTELQLSEEYGVSPMTVRRALEILSSTGRTVSVRGSGTFVSQPGVVSHVRTRSFSQAVLESGMRPSAKVLRIESSACDAQEADLLEMQPGDMVVRLTRLRYADDDPIALEFLLLPTHRYPGLLGLDLSEPLNEVLAAHYDTFASKADSRVSAVLPTQEEATLLDIVPTDPCLRIDERRFDAEGRVLHASHGLFRSDLWEFAISQSFD